MRDILNRGGGFSLPELSCSRQLNMAQQWSFHSSDRNARSQTKALLACVPVAVAVDGTACETAAMQEYLHSAGFDEQNQQITILRPGTNTFLEATTRLVAGALPGDSLVIHYIGGVFAESDLPPDQVITQKQLLSMLLPLPEGCVLTVVMDTCSDGPSTLYTVLRSLLPFHFKPNLSGQTTRIFMNYKACASAE
eukprot:NODE_956_length_712_cov_988.361991_g744_i0.p1 GENE.NODE_956_length_712_cov_988.361991_g744_i0~~NODE_956_length_712_cov_988.361991_g744_i0.p1  ORF type:complete len:194 (+),score=33.61 NODE_956_length_712_cov_988.361991_g744_i0:64-645(+)